MKLNKLCVGFIFLMVGFMATQVMAGSLEVSGSYNVAREVLNAARNIDIPAPVIKLGNTMPNGSLVNLSISGGATFLPAPQTYYLCANNSTGSTNVIGSGATSTNTLAIIADKIDSVGANLIAGSNLWLSSNVNCGFNTKATLNVPVQTAIGSTTLSGNVGYYGSQIDTISANTVVKVANQISTALSTADLVQIDYLGGAANGSTVVQVNGASNLLAMSSNKLIINNNASPNISYGLQNVGGGFNQVLRLADSEGWTGILGAYLTNGSNCTGFAVVPGSAVNAPASGNMVINYANVVTNATTSSAISVTLCVNVAGSVVLPSRTITGSYEYVAGSTGLIAPAGGSNTAWQTWIPNGYQAFNPYMYVGNASSHADDVFVRLYNNSAFNAHVYVDVYPADGSPSQRFALADIAPNTAGLYWAADIGALAGLQDGTSYAALFTVTAPKDQINGVSFMKRAAGERNMPLYKSVNGASNYLQE